MDKITTLEIISLNRSFQNWIAKGKRNKLSQSNFLLTKFSAIHKVELNKLPYKLNLLDDLATNENAHSKFLIRLLQHQPTLTHFLVFLNNRSEISFHFDTDIIKKPLLTAEKMRIDGLIRESGRYAIIIENKIHNAVEQEHQIARYIDKCRMLGFEIDQIYLLYLTRNPWNAPSEQTWGNKYQEANFNRRYAKISYKTEILLWLECYLETLSPKEIFIRSAVVQYIDHLKSLFYHKQKNAAMNQELRSFLSAELNLGDNHTENIENLSEKMTEINELTKQLDALLRISKEELFKEWKKKLEDRFNLGNYQIFEIKDESFLKTGIILKYKELPFSVLIEYDLKSRSIYYGFGKHYASNELNSDIRDFLSPIIDKEVLKKDNWWWYGWQDTSFNDGYWKLEHLIKQTLDMLSSVNSLNGNL